MSNLLFLRHGWRDAALIILGVSVWCCQGRQQLPHSPPSAPDNTETHGKSWSRVEYECGPRVCQVFHLVIPYFSGERSMMKHRRILIKIELQYLFSVPAFSTCAPASSSKVDGLSSFSQSSCLIIIRCMSLYSIDSKLALYTVHCLTLFIQLWCYWLDSNDVHMSKWSADMLFN